MGIAAIILAAGQGTRMKSDLPKVLHEIDGRPMVRFVIDAVKAIGSERVLVVIGYQGERVEEACAGADVEFAWQREQLGTGHAVIQCESAISGFDGTVMVLNGDVPGLRPETLQAFVSYHDAEGAVATVLTTRMPDPTGYGRIVRNDDGTVSRIVEHKDADPAVLAVDEVNSGLFCFDCASLFDALKRTNRENAQNEYYLTDVVELLGSEGKRVAAWCVEDNREVAGVNTLEELDGVRRFINGADA